MWRLWLKTRSAALLSATRLDRALAACTGARRRPLILGYHRVVPEFRPDPALSIPSMNISAATLEAHLDWVARRYDIVSLDEMGHRLEAGEETPRPLAAVTLDDGYRDGHDVAFPLFRRKGIPAAFFLVTDLVGTPEIPIYDRVYYQLARGYAREHRFPKMVGAVLDALHLAARGRERLLRAPIAYDALQELVELVSRAELRVLADAMEAEEPMPPDTVASLRCVDWSMVRRMAAAGMTFGSHTRTHVLLNCEDAQVVRDEAIGSKRRLEAELGAPVRHFAYPAGQFDPAAVQAVAAAGYRYAFTICRHTDAAHPLLTIPRKVLWERSCVDGAGRFSPAILSAQVDGLYDLLSPPCALDHGAKPRPLLAAAAAS
jgi:peptidoglycan/xylan/chitin deacetylase (PgdA/CDA1 family)